MISLNLSLHLSLFDQLYAASKDLKVEIEFGFSFISFFEYNFSSIFNPYRSCCTKNGEHSAKNNRFLFDKHLEFASNREGEFFPAKAISEGQGLLILPQILKY